MVLLNGDIIIVPDKPTTISVVGAVVVPSSVLFTPGHTVGWFVDHAGGFTQDAAKDRILVIRAGGNVIRARGDTRIMMGDVVWVPTKVMAEKLGDKTAEIDSISRNVSAGAILLAVIRALIK
jgi:protein involved in polysaccharide export with SLBB domain